MHSDPAQPSNWPRRDCPSCGTGKTAEWLSLTAERFCSVNSTYRRDFAALLQIDKDDRFPIVECLKCGLVYAARLPPEKFLTAVYDEVIDQQQAMFESESPARLGTQCRIAQAVCQDLQAAAPQQRQYRVLDFGCGYGTLLRIIQSGRIDATGFESSAVRCARLKQRGLAAASSIDELRALPPFDAITLVDVLEHLANPIDVLGLCWSLLAPTGFICVSVPDFPRRRRTLLRRAAEHNQPLDRDVNPWEHLNYFSARSLDQILVQCRFAPLEPLLPVDVGVRPRERGRRRIGNCLKSIRRTAAYALSGSPLGVLRIGARRPA